MYGLFFAPTIARLKGALRSIYENHSENCAWNERSTLEFNYNNMLPNFTIAK